MPVEPFHADRWLDRFDLIADEPELHAIRGAQPKATLEDGRKIAQVLAESADRYGRTSITTSDISRRSGVNSRVVGIHLVGFVYCGLMDAGMYSDTVVRLLHEPPLDFVRDPALLEDLINRTSADGQTGTP